MAIHVVCIISQGLQSQVRFRKVICGCYSVHLFIMFFIFYWLDLYTGTSVALASPRGSIRKNQIENRISCDLVMELIGSARLLIP